MTLFSFCQLSRYVGTSMSPQYLFIILEYVPGGSVAGTLGQFGAFSEPLMRYLLLLSLS